MTDYDTLHLPLGPQNLLIYRFQCRGKANVSPALPLLPRRLKAGEAEFRGKVC